MFIIDISCLLLVIVSLAEPLDSDTDTEIAAWFSMASTSDDIWVAKFFWVLFKYFNISGGDGDVDVEMDGDGDIWFEFVVVVDDPRIDPAVLYFFNGILFLIF